MVNRNIGLPSQRRKRTETCDEYEERQKGYPSSFLNEIEQPLRRKFRRERQNDLAWIILIGLMALTLSYFLVARIVDDQAHAAEVSRESSYSTLCVQYKADSSLTGTAAEETLKQICN